MASEILQFCLIGLQTFQVLFLLLHDWVPLGPLSDLAAMRSNLPRWKVLIGTLIGAAAPTIGWVASMTYFPSPYPSWLRLYLLAAYGFLFMGEIEAWWASYLFGYKPQRAALYQQLTGNSWRFLPLRHGIAPNALHVAVHAATLATLILVAIGMS